MTNSKVNFLRKTAAMAVLLIAYLITTLLKSETWCNILSPINAFAAAGILCFAYLRSDRPVRINITFLLYAVACFAWGIGDTTWAAMSYSGRNPTDSPIVWIIYVIPNCFFAASWIVFAVQQFRKWDLVQFCVDLITTALMTCVLFWILFLNKDETNLHNLLASDFTSVFSVVTDILVFISTITWLLSIRAGKIPSFMWFVSSGMVLFSVVDIYYYYLNYNGMYDANSINDFLYTLSLVVLSYGALWKTYKNSAIRDFSVAQNKGKKRRWIYLLIFPLVAFFASIATIARFDTRDLATFLILIFLNWASGKYIQLSIEKEALLKNANALLEQRVAEQVQELTFLANQDTLTTLFNRRYFMSCLEDTIRNRRTGDTLALLVLDLDRFKTINDTFGHDVGDRVLIDLSYRMIEWNNYGATIARLGGDEFAVMFVGDYTQKDIEDFCADIIDTCSKPISIGGNEFRLTMSIGIAIASVDSCDAKALMQNADIALHRAKSQGYNKYQIFDPMITQDLRKLIELEALLRQTNTEKDFELFYQPQYALPSIELIGAEALIRWKNPEHGYIPPSIFIPIAEEIDYIHKIGKWVMKESIRQSRLWNRLYQTPLKVSFNISPKQLEDKGFISLVKILVTESGVNPGWIEAEITESIMINDADKVDDAFSALRELGISVSIDDFGSGYSALSSLARYPFSRIKIDKSLVGNIGSRNISGVNVIRAAINMAHASGIHVIAEGVETQEQLDLLIELGCDQVQGYLLGRPVPADVFEKRYMVQYLKEAKIAE